MINPSARESMCVCVERGKRGKKRSREGSYLLVVCVSHPSSKPVGASLFLSERSNMKGARLVKRLIEIAREDRRESLPEIDA